MNAVPDPERSRVRLCSLALAEVETRIAALMGGLAGRHRDAVLLDVGCWDGAFTDRCSERLGAAARLGVEVYDGPAAAATARGIEVAKVDLEAERLPWEDASVDVVLCNQVLEHLKNVFTPMSEMHRVLRPGGHAILSVPNLTSLHNRILLALGRQPTSIRVFGPHVRGFAQREFCELIARGGAFAIEQRTGAGFYPIPSPYSAPLARLWPGGSHTTIVLARKTEAQAPWTDFLRSEVEGGVQTYYGDDPAP